MTFNECSMIEKEPDVAVDDALPKPVGWRMLVKPFEIEMVSKGGIMLAYESKDYADVACCVAQVISMGSGCYEEAKFDQPWCKVGDYVIYARHAGQRVEIKRGETISKYLLLNDDDVRATVKDPASIRMYL